jgi:hypothetical protein
MFALKGLDVTEDKEDKGSGAFLFTTQWLRYGNGYGGADFSHRVEFSHGIGSPQA